MAVNVAALSSEPGPCSFWHRLVVAYKSFWGGPVIIGALAVMAPYLLAYDIVNLLW